MPPVEYTKEYFDKQIDLLVDKMHAYDPVSYTHLDVYKRQRLKTDG